MNANNLRLNSQKLRIACAVANVYERDLAKAIGHDPSWITHVKQGNFYASDADIENICSFFGVAVDDLFEANGPN